MTNVEFDLIAFDKASKALVQVAERFEKLIDRAEKLDRKRVNVRVDADTRRADQALDKIGRKAARLDNTQIGIKVDGDKALNVLSLITAGLSTIGHLAPAAVGALAAAPAAVGVLAQGAGALAVSLSGVGDGVKALEAAEEGLAKGGEEAAAAQAKLEEELDKLTPSARSLAEAIHGEILPALRETKGAVQASALPRLEVALKNLLKLSPEVNAGLSETGETIGDLAVRGSAMMTTGPWRADFARIMGSNNRALDDFGMAGLHALDMTRSLTVAGGPLIERFSRATERGAELANQYIQTARASGDLDDMMDQAGDTLAEFAETALQVVTGVTQLAVALGPLGGILLDVLGTVVELVGEFASAHPTLTQFAAGALLATTVVTKLGTGITGLVATGAAAKAGWLALGTAFESTHNRVNRTLGALSVGRTAAQGFAEGLSGAAASADRAAASKSRLTGIVTGLGGKLGALGLALTGLAVAYAHAQGKADDAAAAIAAGGDEAIAKVRELQAVDREAEEHGFGNWIGWISDKIGLATPGLEDMRGELDAVGRAQLRAAEAAANYQAKLNEFGPGTAEAKAAAEALQGSVDQLEQEQRAAGDSTKYHTDQLIQLQNTMLMQVDKDLAFRESLLAVEQAQKNVAEATRDNAASSIEVQQATLGYEGALYRSVQALGEKVRADHASKSASEQNRLAQEAMNNRIFELVNAAGSAAPPALHKMASSLTDADLRARGATVSVNHLGQRVVTLPSGKVIHLDANTAPARGAIQGLVNQYDGRRVSMTVVVDYIRQFRDAAIPRAAGGIDVPGFAKGAVAAMAAGGALSNIRSIPSVATVVPPNTPRLIGDRMRGNESFIPWDKSERSRKILEKTAQAMGYALAPVRPVRPMARGGMIQAEDGSWVPAGYYDDDSPAANSARDPNRGKPGYVQAEDGSWVPTSFYGGRPGPPRDLDAIKTAATAATAALARMAAARSAPIRFEFRSTGRRLEDLIIELIRKAIRDQGGGDVQAYLGR